MPLNSYGHTNSRESGTETAPSEASNRCLRRLELCGITDGMIRKVAILGASGTIGKHAGRMLAARGTPVRVVGRNEAGLHAAYDRIGAEIVTADLATREGCLKAVQGSSHVLYTIGLPYSVESFKAYPPMMQFCIEAALRSGVEAIILISNVYAYGIPQTPTVSEDHPRVPVAKKGEYRKRQEDILLASHEPNGLHTLSLRLPDFYGPEAYGAMTHVIFDTALQAKTANVPGPVDTPHEFVFTPDVGKAVVELFNKPEAFGTAYNFAGPGEITIREFAAKVYAAAGIAKPKIRPAGKMMLRLAGLFSPLLHELVEMSYLQETPVILNDDKLRRVLPNFQKTSYDEGIARTIEWYRSK